MLSMQKAQNNTNKAEPTAPRIVLVPIANPDNALNLLELGLELTTDNTNENARVIALVVLNGEPNGSSETAGKIEDAVNALAADGKPVELRTRRTSSVARGIVDTANEVGAHLIVLGVSRGARGNSSTLGAVVENVLLIAPCDVAIYRPGQQKQDVIKRIVVPTDGSKTARAAYGVAARISDYFGVGIEVMHAQESYRPSWEGRGRIAETIEGQAVAPAKQTLITASNAGEGILARLEPTDLVAVGYSSRSRFERWLFGDVSQRLLDGAPGPVILTVHHHSTNEREGYVRRWLRRFAVRLTPSEQDEIVFEGYSLSTLSIDYLVLIVVSAMIASFGLLANSTAVIIGAMLVAPFMQPCIGFAAGLASGRVLIARKSFLTLLMGVVVAFIVAWLAGALVPNWQVTSEMAARTNPTILDAAIAFASGIMGAYATARKEIPSALAGVAIAAALMPPLCTFGLEMALGRPDLAVRAFLLFVTNIAFISAAAMMVFFALGMRPEFTPQTRRRDYIAALVFTVLALPFLILMLNLSQRANEFAVVREVLSEGFPNTNIVDIEYREGDNGEATVRARVESPYEITREEMVSVQTLLEARIDRAVDLALVTLPVLEVNADPAD